MWMKLIEWELLRWWRMPRVLVGFLVMCASMTLSFTLLPWSSGRLMMFLFIPTMLGIFASTSRMSPEAMQEARFLLTRAVRPGHVLVARWIVVLGLFALVLALLTSIRVASDSDYVDVYGYEHVARYQSSVPGLAFQRDHQREELERWMTAGGDEDQEPVSMTIALPGVLAYGVAVSLLVFAINLFALALPGKRKDDPFHRSARRFVHYTPILALAAGSMVLFALDGLIEPLLFWAYTNPLLVLAPLALVAAFYAWLQWRTWERGDFVA